MPAWLYEVSEDMEKIQWRGRWQQQKTWGITCRR